MSDADPVVRNRPRLLRRDRRPRGADRRPLGHAASPTSRLRLIDRGAALVSDDYTDRAARRRAGCSPARPPTIAGKIEVRGVGIVELPAVRRRAGRLFVDLDRDAGAAARAGETARLAGVAVPVVALSGA